MVRIQEQMHYLVSATSTFRLPTIYIFFISIWKDFQNNVAKNVGLSYGEIVLNSLYVKVQFPSLFISSSLSLCASSWDFPSWDILWGNYGLWSHYRFKLQRESGMLNDSPFILLVRDSSTLTSSRIHTREIDIMEFNRTFRRHEIHIVQQEFYICSNN